MGASVRKKRGKLTAFQRRFVAEYLVDQKGAAAIRRAGYVGRHASSRAAQLVKLPQVWQAIQAAQAEQFQRLSMTADEAVAIASCIARAKRTDAFDDTGKLKPFSEWSEDLKHAFAGFDVEERSVQAIEGGATNDGVDLPARVVRTTLSKVKFHDKAPFVGLIMRKHGLLKDRLQHEATESFAAMVAASFAPEKPQDPTAEAKP